MKKRLTFLGKKIEKCNTAIFYNESRNILRFPTCVIQLLQYDGEGFIYFKVRKPYTDISTLDKHFPSCLHFFKKGCNYHLYLNGDTLIVKELSAENEVLLRFKTYDIFYLPLKREKKVGISEILLRFTAGLHAKEHNYLAV